MAFSGGYFTYHTYYKKGFQLVDNFSTNPKPENKIQEGTALNINGLLKHPDIKYYLRAVYIPTDSTEAYQFRYINDRFIVPGLRKTRELKLAQNGKVENITSFESAPFSEQIAAQMYPVHIGEIMGLPGRILVFISGFIPVILFITGLRYYRFRVHKKNKI